MGRIDLFLELYSEHRHHHRLHSSDRAGVDSHGVVTALVVVVGLTAINCIGDYAITPRLMSQGLGLSQFTIFFSFFVWRILRCDRRFVVAPLTLLVKLLLETNDDTRRLAVLMDDKVPAGPPQPDMQAAQS